MARLMVGADNIACSIGACAPVGQGGYTMLWLYKLTQFSGVGGLGSLRKTGEVGGFARDCLITGNRLFGLADFSNGFPAGPLPEALWLWSLQSKPDGAAHYQWAYGLYPITDPDAQIIFGESPVNPGNHGDPGAGDAVWIGGSQVGGNRTIALQAFFSPMLSPVQIKGALTKRLIDVLALAPVGCWPLNQVGTDIAVIDVTGNGADQVLLTGTTVAADPPEYDFSLIPPQTAVSWEQRIEAGPSPWQIEQSERDSWTIEAGPSPWQISQG